MLHWKFDKMRDYNYVGNFAPFFEILPENASSLTPSKSFLNERTTSKILSKKKKNLIIKLL